MSLPESLVEQSTLTPRQLEVLRLYVRVAHGEMKYVEAASKASQGRTKGASGPLTIGSYFRTVQQARENVKSSVVTLLIGVWLGVVKPDDVRRLLDVAGSGVRTLSEEETARLAGVLRELVKRIVM
ncbi:MAG: hypothetical protein JRN54_06315 [Nitrososphaerota archaeon]|nr:hypothetical protein [Nitrososphaerota archaeon]MDG6956185.1 hypothetical protein [Nitrososphaerota archaeon]MDG6970703.1 hypothetical protein [Nitrososphaerota archaeon]MDG6980559.1 hypothetical protein [Nitrososphaerota archaeon]MDG7008740.1 hypothetical protein [Nitrososphaerota archaeon]